ncbi:DUF2024 family protein [Fulvivirga lutea]|uniref:DUF2024 family protein n=1 Tax=Fulvivirga lutea TaxID=2810512 RepID=A0A975A0E1_9BACT|nr:DUF2024 family protein [Fulvivirga lutea]QSE96342.1 DUF2024 family protein [Fulvivirga lutea]
MQAAVYDTYVTKKDGNLMHFDIVVPANELPKKVLIYGQNYLESKNQQGQSITTKECQFCHIEEASPEMIRSFSEQGYFIIEMQGC